MTSSSQPVAAHPKDVLYDGAYDPLTSAWFEALAKSPERQRLLDEIPSHDLIAVLERFNRLFHQLVDDCLAGMNGRDELVEIVSRHREHVLWAGHMAPGTDADVKEVATSLGRKMKRNISLGVIEALICLESAYVFCRDKLGLRGSAMAETLRRSRQLYKSLAVLHDEQEKSRLMFLTGISGYLAFPEHDWAAVITGRIQVTPDKFLVSGPDDALRLRFVTPPVQDIVLDSPVRRCPAHRLPSAEDPGMSLNDVLWDLLIDIYRRAGRFA